MLFAYRPETPLSELLRFNTDILEKKGGTEQRIALRVAPRTEYKFDVIVEDGLDRQRIENLFFGKMDQTFLVPAWPECGFLESAAASGANTLSVSTWYSQFRAGGAALLVGPDDATELVENITVGTDVLTFASGLAAAWPAGTEVYPVRQCIHPDDVRSRRYGTNAVQYSFNFRCLDDNISLYPRGIGSTGGLLGGAYPDAALYVIDDPNANDGTVNEGWSRRVQVVDAGTGAIQAVSYTPRSRRTSVKGWKTDRDILADVRTLLHYWKGRQGAFLLPTFAGDCTPVAGATSGAFTLDVANAGFSSYNGLTHSRKYLRVYKANGTVVTRQVASVAATSSTVERITVTAAWPTIALEDIVRITILEKVRIDSDDITIVHSDLVGTAKVAVPVRSVLE